MSKIKDNLLLICITALVSIFVWILLISPSVKVICYATLIYFPDRTLALLFNVVYYGVPLLFLYGAAICGLIATIEKKHVTN